MTDPTDTARGTGTHSGAAREWYTDAGGRTDGPLSDDELRARAAAGQLRPADGVSSDRATWVPAGTVPWLVFPSAAVRAPGAILDPGATLVPDAPAARPVRPLVETVVAGSTNAPGASGTSPEFSPLDSVPGYDLLGLLGTGACGVVFRAVQKKLDRVVALKTVRMAENTPDDLIARFEQEAVSLARLQHPNIVAVYDCGHTGGRAYFAMELLDGEDLSQRLARDGPLDERTAWLVARQTAAALDHAAKHGVIHRDIKPANLFLVPPPTGFPLPSGVPMVKVTDFGLALTLRGPDESDPGQSAAGAIIGTPVYMAPEQFRGGPVDVGADIYSLGATVYHVLTGVIPFDGRTLSEVMEQKGAPAPRLAAPFSEPTADLVAAMMANDARDRPSNYGELIARIDALPCLDGAFSSAGLPVATPAARPAPEPATPPKPKRARWVYAVAAAVVLGAAVGAAALGGAFNRPAHHPDPGAPAPPVSYARGQSTDLFANSVLGWTGELEIKEKDAEGNLVLTAKGTVTRKLSAYPNFGLYMGIALHRATAVDIVLATTDGPPASATRWVVRLDPKTGAALGKCVGAGAFEPLGPPVAVQFAAENKSPSRELRYELAGGVLSVWFASQPLGSTTDASLHSTELRLHITGGPIRIGYADEVELVEQN